MIIRCRLSCIIFIMLWIEILNAQPGFDKKVFTTDNGLPHNQIEYITQDHEGFLWIATWDGLSRFDGYNFKNYYHNSGDSTSFPFFSLDKVITDKYNTLWIFSEGRPPVIYNKETDKFSWLTFGSDHKILLNDITLDPDSILWFTAGMSIGRYDSGMKKLRFYRTINNTSFRYKAEKSGLQLVFDNNFGLWLYYTEDSEYKILRGTFQNDSTILLKDFGSIPFKNQASASLHNTTGNINVYLSDSSQIWFFSRYGLFRYDKDAGQIVRNPKNPDAACFKGRPFYIWTDDESGIHIIDTETDSILVIKPDGKDYTETTFIDNSGIIWSGNTNMYQSNIGLHEYIRTPGYFKTYPGSDKGRKASFTGGPILKIGKGILVCSSDRKNLVWINQESKETEIQLTDPNVGANSSKILTLLYDSSRIWIGTEGPMYYCDINTENSSFAVRSIGIAKGGIPAHDLIKSGEGLVINGSKGVFKYSEADGHLFPGYEHKPEGTGFSIAKGRNGGYWLGYWGSTVIYLDDDLNGIRSYKIGMENNIIESICVGDSNDIWIALMGEGLGHLYPESSKTEIFTTACGLVNNVTYSIIRDRKGILWISNNQGISRFDPATRHFRNFGASEGLTVTQFNTGSACLADDGEIFFGGVGGFVSFNPLDIDSAKADIEEGKLIITEFKVSGISRYFRKQVNDYDTLILNKGDNNFQVTFSCLNFRYPERIRYRYRLIGVNKQWMETDFRNRSVSFARLTPNLYTLEMQATDPNGQWATSKSIKIYLPPFFTETILFKTLITLAILLILLAILYVYIRQIRIKAMQTQNLLKLESLRGQMNPHFIFNSLNSINYFILNEDKFAANDYIADFSRLIRTFLDNMTSDYIQFHRELNTIRDYLKLEHLRFGDKFDYTINTDNLADIENLYVFPGLIQPFIENAIWHGIRRLGNRKGCLRVRFQNEKPGVIRCTVEDDGVGRKIAGRSREKFHSGKSHGIDIVKDRLKIINNITRSHFLLTIDDLYPDRHETGTRVTIQLPVMKM